MSVHPIVETTLPRESKPANKFMMKTWAKNPSLLFGVVAALVLVLPRQVSAQPSTLVHAFTGLGGLYPYAGLILSGNTLYGTTYGDCVYNCGTVFKVNTDGTGFTNLHLFTSDSNPYATNSDGANPQAGLILSGNALYGTASGGGTFGSGTVFQVNTDGSGFVNLHNFTRSDGNALTNSDGANPYAGLILSGSTLYGTTSDGGSFGNGTVFALNTDGTGFATLHDFTAFPPYPATPINSDGANPQAGLVLSGNTLYGVARAGGGSGNGTVFAVNIDASGFTNLYNFTKLANTGNNSDGANPQAGLILSGNALYGTASDGGSFGNGTVFAVNTDGSGFVNLHNFTKLYNTGNNSDGANPYAGLILSGNTLYGTATAGGTFGAGIGTVFAVNTDGTDFSILHTFTNYPSDGANPFASLVLSGNILYGTTIAGGALGGGTVFSLSLTPSPLLTITRAGPNVILSWQTNSTGLTLQSTTNLASLVWNTNSTPPILLNGQNTVTNPISGTQQFFRLSQ